ncbi:electron-transfer-flavoprotein, alpha polypeptide [Toxoplasma gondii RUB]|uniref:Electron-transfer-flavoprotein, alpha polypeptide n=1 Tax=Toxoplasma gondii RUB TaxID=935652 RepID=A0A086LKL8_TOXGO|nr:electron-transfer-flavoprotein, alpha polypeptide [Toxoplasma gondii RUB]
MQYIFLVPPMTVFNQTTTIAGMTAGRLSRGGKQTLMDRVAGCHLNRRSLLHRRSGTLRHQALYPITCYEKSMSSLASPVCSHREISSSFFSTALPTNPVVTTTGLVFRRRFTVTLVIADHSGKTKQAATHGSNDHGTAKTVTPPTLAAIQAASFFRQPVEVLLCGKNTSLSPHAECLSYMPGVSRVLQYTNAAMQHYPPVALAVLLRRLQHERDVSVICGSSSGICVDALPRLSALLDVQPIADVVAVKDANTFVRQIYAGTALCTVKSSDKVKVLTVCATAFPLSEKLNERTGNEPAPIEHLPAVDEFSQLTWITEDVTLADKPQLDAAEIVVAGGRGLKSRSEFARLLEPLRARLRNAAIGASRAAVDSGYAAYDLQIGQTGKVVAPKLYIGVGLSGAIQHMTGMKDSKVIVAINNDLGAPIFQIADYCVYGDLFQVVPELTAKLPQQ